ncbi:hypothetical protein GF338_09720 [candidate division WOR-3 bacterium]|nr:hypothetical protein [candidate division WOR-3 bacterium]
MKNEVWLDEVNQVVRQKLIDDAILEEAPEYFQEVKRLLDSLPHRYAIVDLSEAATRTMLNREAREYIVTYSAPMRYERLAYIKASPPLRIMAKIMKALALRKHADDGEIAFFATEDEALQWLKDGANGA